MRPIAGDLLPSSCGHCGGGTGVRQADRRAVRLRVPQMGGPPPHRGGGHVGSRVSYGLTAKLRVVQPELEALPPGAASMEVPHTWPVVPVVGAAGSGLAPA